jgi:23S rRNA (adenine2503-C2)-methyltransferase
MESMFEAFIQTHTLPNYRVQQLYHGFYQEYLDSFQELSTWPKDLREKIIQEVPFTSLRVELHQTSKRNDTEKVRFIRKNGKMIESVLMRHTDGRNTVCVSCMSGCPIGCTFCATGKLGFQGNLDANEIVDQVLYFARKLKKENQSVSNIVYMGMGEPMLNLKEVQKSIEILTDPGKVHMSMRRITVSTSGILSALQTFIDSGFRGRLAISLHAPNQAVRERIMPIAKSQRFDALLKIIDSYIHLTNKRVSIEYILIKNINDRKEHARELSRLFAGKLVHINCIPYNPVKGVSYERPSREDMNTFVKILSLSGIPHTLRITMGDDIMAACGQLDGASEGQNS